MTTTNETIVEYLTHDPATGSNRYAVSGAACRIYPPVPLGRIMGASVEMRALLADLAGTTFSEGDTLKKICAFKRKARRILADTPSEG